MTEPSPSETIPRLSRDDLVALVTRAHLGAPYAECKVAGSALADHSKLPRLVAENLGAGFGQWTFFPDAGEIVDFAGAYAPPQNADDMWTLARAWASDDAASRHTALALIGRDILLMELRRIDVPELRALFAERGSRAHAMRKDLGLDAPLPRASVEATTRKSPRTARPAVAKAEAPPAVIAAVQPMKMPKPILQRSKVEEPPPPKHFEHPKFGVGVLERQDGGGDEAKLTIRFATGTKTLLARFVTEVGA